MKKAVALLCLLLLGFATFVYISQKEEKTNLSSKIFVDNKEIKPSVKKTFLFIPYWTFSKSVVDEDFDSLIFFGIAANKDGIDKNEDGYRKINTFMSLTDPSKERILAVRMTDSSFNADVLKNATLQKKIINDAVGISKENNFDGVLLDFETSAFGFENTIKNISNFYSLFADAVHKNNLLFYSSLFGDTYFRARAYDIEKIGKMSDKVLVMTYDFHKSRGNPGPNFPLRGKEEYGYDLEKMIEDYQRDVDNEKIVIVLGYFGYDWQVDKDNHSMDDGLALSTNKIRQDFINACVYKNCALIRNSNNEPSIKYTDDENLNHAVWFEDEISIQEKLDLLSQKGVNQTGIWAYSYY